MEGITETLYEILGEDDELVVRRGTHAPALTLQLRNRPRHGPLSGTNQVVAMSQARLFKGGPDALLEAAIRSSKRQLRSLLLANEERAPQVDPETPAKEG